MVAQQLVLAKQLDLAVQKIECQCTDCASIQGGTMLQHEEINAVQFSLVNRAYNELSCVIATNAE